MQLDTLLRTMIENKATAMHLVIGEQPVMRAAGQLTRLEENPINATVLELVLQHSLSPDQRELLAHRGYTDLSLSHAGRRFVCRLYRERGQLAAAIRYISSTVPTLETTSLIPEERARLAQVMQFRKGLLIVTGGGGSGRTTLCAALLDHVNTNASKRIVTIEEPVQFDLQHRQSLVTQQMVGHDVDSFLTGLKAAQALDADIVFVSEIPDYATLEAVSVLAERGKLVVTTMDFPSASACVRGIFDDYAPKHPGIRELLSRNLQAIITTSLVPKINSRERIAAFEIMIATLKIRATIGDGRWEFGALMKDGRKMGMQLMDDSLARLLESGLISYEEAEHRISDKSLLSKG